MDTLTSMRALVRVVELGGLAAAARNMGLSPAMIAKHIAHLESRTGARLLNRTTRIVRPTESGQLYYERCVALLAGIDEAEGLAGAGSTAPTGTLRLTAPVEFGNAQMIGPVAAFSEAHPGIVVDIDLTNRVVDMVQEGFDLAIRVAPALDTAMVGRKLASSRFHIVASPEYLRRHGWPRDAGQLSERHALVFSVPQARDEWPVGQQGSVKVAAKIRSSSAEMLRQAALAGVGISWLPSFVCGHDLSQGRLVSLFPDQECGSLGIYALYPHRRFLPVRLRLFLDFLSGCFGGDADSDPWAPR